MDTGRQEEPSSDEGGFPRRLGPYVLVTFLGEGGMGRVYLALERTPTGDHLVSIKLSGNHNSHFAPEQIRENQERFAREAEISGALDHPCIARTHHAVYQAPDSYLVQEFVNGMTLENLVAGLADDGEQMPVPLAVHIVSEIASALVYLHDFRDLGLVHRDLTSANVMVSRTGEVKIIDFGIAKATRTHDTLTRPHVLVGKPLWTAPEILEGGKPDRRADLFSLGLIFWHVLTGRDPAERLAADQTLPPPSTFNPAVGTDCDHLVARAVHPRPEDRFQTGTEFLENLAPHLPPDFHGPRQLAQLLAAREGQGKKQVFDELVERARALLDMPTMPFATEPTRKRRVLPVTILMLSVTGAGVAVLTTVPSLAPTATFTSQTILPSLPDSATDGFIPLFSPPAPAPERASPPASQPPPTPSDPSSKRDEPRGTAAPVAAKPAEALVDDALEAFAASDFRTALKLARASANQHPNVDAYILIGRILFITDPAGARAALEKALRLAPDNAQATRLLEALRQPPSM